MLSLPELLSPDLQLVIAVFLGMGFGFVLEQAGFGDSRRLAGLFYGYDFVVLRVFFTAGVTAMIGVSALAYFGLVQLDLIFVNPLFVRSAIAGGLIMGLGFILGGFCPGTSVCSAASGRIDGMVFVGGTLIGVFAYAELYPLIADFVVADSFGGMTVPELFGISRGFFILLVAVIAAAAFVFTALIEDKVNGRPLHPAWRSRRAMGFVAAGLVVAAMVLLLPDKKSSALATIDTGDWEQQAAELDTMPLDELLSRMIARENGLRLVDVRPADAYAAGHLPTAVNVPLAELAAPRWTAFLRNPAGTTVLYCQSDVDARKAAVLLDRLDAPVRTAVLAGGYDDYAVRVIGDGATDPAFRRFRDRALPELERLAAEAAPPPKPEVKSAVKGGC